MHWKTVDKKQEDSIVRRSALRISLSMNRIFRYSIGNEKPNKSSVIMVPGGRMAHRISICGKNDRTRMILRAMKNREGYDIYEMGDENQKRL